MRALASFFVDRWQISAILLALMIALGLGAAFSIPKSEDPPVDFPINVVTVVLPGANAQEMEQLVAIPLEQAISRIEDIDQIETTVSANVASVTAEFTWGSDPQRKYDEFVREVNASRVDLPDGVTSIEFLRANTANAAVAQIALVGEDVPVRRLEALARTLRDELERARGVQEAEIWGAPQAEVRIGLDLARLAELRIPASAVADAIAREGAAAPLGAVEAGGRRFNVQSGGFYDSLEEIKAVPVRAAEGRVVFVGDLATVEWADGEDRHITRFNGERAVFVTARAKLGEDVFAVRKELRSRAEAFARDLPADVRLEYAFDQSKTVASRLGKLGRDFAIAVSLVLLTLLPLGFRASVVVMMSIPLSLSIGILLMQTFGYTMNQLSVAGFIVALGLLVDDSIVVTENIARRLREGLAPREAAIEGLREIDVAVLGCTATLMLAFLPLLALPEAAGEFIRSLPAAVLTTVAASLVIALTIIPFLAARLLDPRAAGHSNAALDAVMGAIHRVYRPALHVALTRPLATVAGSLALVILVCALTMPRIGFSLFPENDSALFMVEVELPEGSAVSETDKAVRFAEQVLAKEPTVAWVMSNSGQGNPQVYYNYFQVRQRSNIGGLFASFEEYDPDESPQVIARLRKELAAYPGAKINLVRFQNGPPVDAPIAVRVQGRDIAALQELSLEVERILRETPGTRDVANPLSERLVDLDLNLDQQKAALLGVPAGAADQAVRIAIGGERAASFIDPAGDAYPVRVRLAADGAPPADALERLYVWTATGDAVPLTDIADPQFKSGPSRIARFDKERTVTITAFPQDGYLTSTVTADIISRLESLSLPPGFSIDFGGEAEAAEDSFGGLGPAVLIALFGIVAVLLLEFRTFAMSTVVAFVIPFGIMGGVLALYVTGESLSFVAAIGFIALIGIEIKNSILLVDFANKLRERGVPLKEAVERAGEVRFLPVLLTSVTAIGGLTPLVLEESPLVSPLAIVIIGGLISSTILARIVTPAMYLLLAPKDVSVRAGAEPAH